MQWLSNKGEHLILLYFPRRPCMFWEDFDVDKMTANGNSSTLTVSCLEITFPFSWNFFSLFLHFLPLHFYHKDVLIVKNSSSSKIVETRKYLLHGYILGVSMNTITWNRLYRVGFKEWPPLPTIVYSGADAARVQRVHLNPLKFAMGAMHPSWKI